MEFMSFRPENRDARSFPPGTAPFHPRLLNLSFFNLEDNEVGLGDLYGC